MYAQIVIDCQTKNEPICCGYCIVKSDCRLRFEIDNIKKIEKEPQKLLVRMLAQPIEA
jgi:hypothetical protein